MDTFQEISEKIKNFDYKKNKDLQKALESLSLDQLKKLALDNNIITNQQSNIKTKKLTKLIISYYSQNKCSVQKPCLEPDESCNLETGKCENLIKTEITDQYGQNIKVIGTPDNIKNVEQKITSLKSSISSQADQTSMSIINYRLQSFYDDGMVETENDGDCFFHCIRNLIKLTHNTDFSVSELRQKISNVIKLLIKIDPPIIDQESLINEFDTVNTIQDYLTYISNTGWAGEPEIIAASNLYNKIIIIKTLKLNIPDRIYFPSATLPNRNVQHGLWILYHVNQEDLNKEGNHYNYKGNQLSSQHIGSITDINLLEEIIDLNEALEQDITPSMSIISSEGIQFAGNPESLRVLNEKGIIKTTSQRKQNVSQDISLPFEENSIDKPEESNILDSIESKSDNNSSINKDIQDYLYPNLDV